MVSRSSFMLKSYGGDPAAKPLIGRQTKVAQHVVKYGGGVQCMHGGGGATPSTWLAATDKTWQSHFQR